MLEAVLDFFQIEAGLLLLWDQDKELLSNVAAQGFLAGYLEELSSGRLETIIGPYLSRAYQPLVIDDIHADNRLATSTFSELIQADPRFTSVVSIPLKYREQVTGFINLAAAHHKPETPMQWIIAVAERVSSGWDRVRFENDCNRALTLAHYRRSRMVPLFIRS